jgi:Flp pilus assembly protein TadB
MDSPDKRWTTFAKLVPFYLLCMGAAVALMAVVAVLAPSWAAGAATVLLAASACFVARRTGDRLSASPDE